VSESGCWIREGKTETGDVYTPVEKGLALRLDAIGEKGLRALLCDGTNTRAKRTKRKCNGLFYALALPKNGNNDCSMGIGTRQAIA
jgi:hypothetical protein